MTTDTDPRVQHAMELAERFAVSIAKQFTTLGANRAALREYLAAEFAEVPSAPVGAVPRMWCAVLRGGTGAIWKVSRVQSRQEVAQACADDWNRDHDSVLRATVEGVHLATTPPQAEPLQSPLNIAAKLDAMADNYRGGHSWDALDTIACKAGAAALRRLAQSVVAEIEIDRLETELALYKQSATMYANWVMSRDEGIARLTEELADEKAVVDCLRSELADRLQKQRAAEAELTKERADTNWLRTNLEGLSGEKDAALRWVESLRAELQEVRKDAARWQNIRWHWEDERDMGRGGRWWTALWCNDKPATAEEAFDARIEREATNGRPE